MLTFNEIIKSYDIFDTVITRTVIHPDHLHWAVGRTLRREGLISESDETWRQIRIAAEHRARRKKNGAEVSISDIYGMLMPKLASQHHSRAIEIELALELTHIRPVPPIQTEIKALRNAGTAPIFISDIYLDSQYVNLILARCGYDPDPGALFLSSVIGTTKASGQLFEHVKRTLGKGLHHTGDHPLSDVKIPRQHGCIALQFTATKPTQNEEYLFFSGNQDYISSVIAGAARLSRLKASERHPDVSCVAASVVGPLLSSYVLSLTGEAQRLGIRRLFFLARDGQILARVAKLAVQWAGYEIDCRYILGSRQAFHLASLPTNLAMALTLAVAESASKTVQECLVELEFNCSAGEAILEDAKLSSSTLLDNAAAAALRHTLAKSPWAGVLTTRIAERKTALCAYLTQQGFFDGERSAIVDLGWLGNVQRRLEAAVREARPDGVMGFYYNLVQNAGLEGRVWRYTDNRRNGALLEAFCVADHTSTKGFSVGDDGAAYGMGIEPDARSLAWGVDELQKGVLDFAEAFFSTINRSLYSPEEVEKVMRKVSSRQFGRFLVAPLPDEAEVFGRIFHAAAQAHLFEVSLAPRLNSIGLGRMLVSKRYRRAIGFWPIGSIVRSRHSAAGKILYIFIKIYRYFDFMWLKFGPSLLRRTSD